MKWYGKKLAYNQAIVIDEGTGDNVAAVFDQKNAPVVACAPELLEMLKRLLAVAENELDQSATHDGLNNCDLLRDVRVLLYKVEEGE